MQGTASENVSILDDSFYFPSLSRHRRIWIYKPKNYDHSDERYPVIYMHDGQNLFDELNAFGSEWGVDEILDAEEGKVIVIGIDNGAEHRMSEYMVHDHPEHGIAEGVKYLKDVTEILKPYVDGILRTLPQREATCIAGSSMGGLISLYAGLYYPQIFGAVGVFSPALWIDAPQVFEEAKTLLTVTQDTNHNIPLQRWFFYAGALESETMVAEVASMVAIMGQSKRADVSYQLDAGGVHDEAVWKRYFPHLYKWFIQSATINT
jgi:predicted alpha/beta superfamily hydrolase